MIRAKTTDQQKAPRVRTDGRKGLLVYLDAGLIKDLKKAGLDDDRNVYDIVEEASRDWLARRGKKTRPK
jgi:hypothetical protein